MQRRPRRGRCLRMLSCIIGGGVSEPLSHSHPRPCTECIDRAPIVSGITGSLPLVADRISAAGEAGA